MTVTRVRIQSHEISSEVRRMRLGAGLVTPVKPVYIGGELLEPGRDRMIPDHELVRGREHLFTPVHPDDDARAIVRFLERKSLREREPWRLGPIPARKLR
jgi:hypothetical protein